MIIAFMENNDMEISIGKALECRKSIKNGIVSEWHQRGESFSTRSVS